MITCDRTKPRHYELDRQRYFSVSQVCDVITGGQHWGSQEAMDRGTTLHRLFALSVAASAGLCAFPVIPDDYAGYATSWSQWLGIAKPEPLALEERQVSTIRGLPFAGTIDFFGLLHDNGKRVKTIVDLKTGQKEPWHRLQVQAYGKLWPEAERLAILYVHEDGSMPTWQIVKPSTRDWTLFQNAISVLLGRELL